MPNPSGASWSVMPPDEKTASTPPDKATWAPPAPEGKATINGMDPALWEAHQKLDALGAKVAALERKLDSVAEHLNVKIEHVRRYVYGA